MPRQSAGSDAAHLEYARVSSELQIQDKRIERVILRRGIWAVGGRPVLPGLTLMTSRLAETVIGKECEGLNHHVESQSCEYISSSHALIYAQERSHCRATRTSIHLREVLDGKLIDQGVIRYKLGHMAKVVEAQQAWIEQIVYQMDNMSKADGDRLLGGTTGLLRRTVVL